MLNGDTWTFQLGDYDNQNNGTRLEVSDDNNAVYVWANGESFFGTDEVGLAIDPSGLRYRLGDYGGRDNGTHIDVFDDDKHYIIQSWFGFIFEF